MTRDQNRQVHLLMNRCRHRGNELCQRERGHASYFTCRYHGWTYSNTGALVSIPFERGVAGYDDTLRKEELGVTQVARMAIYRGFVFGSLNPAGQSFEEYIGHAKAYIDQFVDLAPEGEIVANTGRHKVRIRANWKMLAENFVDHYHFAVVHQSRRLDAPRAPALNDPNHRMRNLSGGHACLDHSNQRRKPETSVGTMTGSGLQHPAIIEAVTKRLGQDKAQRLFSAGPPHVFIFPNLLIARDAFRLIQPVGPGEFDYFTYPALLKGAPEEVNIARLRANEWEHGAAGVQSGDDGEVLERQQLGFKAQADEWLLLKRGLHEEHMEPDEFGVNVPSEQGLGELTQRAVWRHYKKLMMQA